MQLSNFWRDIGQDWKIGRVYIPQEDMERFQVREEELAQGRVTANFVNLLEFQIERTEAYYAHAYPGVEMLATGRLGVMLGLYVYRAILRDIRRRGYDVFRQRAGANFFEKFALIAISWREVRRR
jgi:phytoene synthase